jgi:Carboxypeptidase regulatory-like domain
MKIISMFAFTVLLCCGNIWAQSTARIHGTVQDSTGAVIPGAEVNATQTETAVSRSTTTAADGAFVLTQLPLGPYRLQVAKQGFATTVQTGIVLQVGSDPGINIVLNVGGVSQQVTVESTAPLVETTHLGVGEVVQTQRIVDLPLNGRNVTDLVTLAGASVQTGTGQNRWFGSDSSPVPIISIGGSSAAGGSGGDQLFTTEYVMDGANHVNILSGSTMPIPFPDAVQEFRVEATGQTAQRGASTSVSVVTRSGSNQFHGDLFEFIRNDGFGSAREYFSPVASTLKRNQFGGTIGGPIKKDKAFFFFGYQGTRLRQNLPETTVVPTPAIMSGDWTAYATTCQEGTPVGHFVNNIFNPAAVFTKDSSGNITIPTSFYTPQALYMANAFLNNLEGLKPDQCGNITYQVPTHENDNQYIGKVDFQLSAKQSIFFRSLDTHLNYPAALAGCTFDLQTELLSGNCVSHNMLNASVTGANQLAHSYTFGHTYVISSSMVNSFRFAFNRTADTNSAPQLFSLCDAGVNIWCGGTPGQIGPASSISGGFSFGYLGNGDYWDGQNFSLNEDLSWIKGAHELAFGFGGWEGKVYEFNHFTPAGALVQFNGSVAGSANSPCGMCDFLLGDMFLFLQGLPNDYVSYQKYVDLYFSDTWRVNSHLTMTYGIRWAPFLPPSILDGHISSFDMSRYTAGTTSTQFANAPPGLYFPGDPGFPDQSSTNRRWAHFEPHIGLAWDPKGDGKTSIRASYSFGYANIPLIAHEDEGGSNPWGGRITLVRPAGGLASPWLKQPGGNPFPYTVDANVPFPHGGQYVTVPYDLPAPSVFSYNLSVQRQFGSSWVATVTYIGSRVQHMYITQAINYATCPPPAVPGVDCTAAGNNVQARRVLTRLNPAAGAFFGNVATWFPFANQYYNGLLASVQKRLSRGVSLNGNWTWSHCIGYYQGFNTKPEETATNPANPLYDRGDCDSDRRNIVNVTALFQTPSITSISNQFLRVLASNWQLSVINRYISGAPIDIQDGVDQELSGINHQRPNLVDPNAIYTGQICGGCFYLNKSAFALQPLGTVGNLGWNAVRSPGYWAWDMSLARNFPIGEHQALQLRADAFNVTNSFIPAYAGTSPVAQSGTASLINAGVPSFSNLTTAQFGQILAAFPTRKMQFSFKYTF